MRILVAVATVVQVWYSIGFFSNDDFGGYL